MAHQLLIKIYSTNDIKRLDVAKILDYDDEFIKLKFASILSDEELLKYMHQAVKTEESSHYLRLFDTTKTMLVISPRFLENGSKYIIETFPKEQSNNLF